MIRYQIDEITEEMVLGESIFAPSGELLLGAGYHVKGEYLKRLRELGYQSLLIHVEGTEEAKPVSTVTEETQREMLGVLNNNSRELSRSFDSIKFEGVNAIEKTVHENRQYLGRYIMNSGITAALEKFLEEIMGHGDVLVNLTTMKQSSEAIFAHAMNVTITALCIGRKYNFSFDEMKQLGIGALNHDLGLVAVPEDILNKPTTLTEGERDVLRQHPSVGYLMLAEFSTIPATSSAVALQHHENQAGNGYPRGIRGENRPPVRDITKQNIIHRFAEIVAVADQYDMLTTGRRHYATRIPVHQAIKQLILNAGTMLNSEIVRTLVSIVPIYPVGARIRITKAPSAQLEGYMGVVAKDNPAALEKPQIILFESRGGQKIKPFIIDTAKYEGFVLELV